MPGAGTVIMSGGFFVFKIEKPQGTIEVSGRFFANLVAHAASECFGVAGLALSGPKQGFRRFLGQEISDQGVRIRHQNGDLLIDLHIAVTYGINITAIVKSIVNKVSYAVEDATGLRVGKVNVFVDEMKTE
jgi:uncharacterized alkaline shock family protein YloU